MLPNGLKLFIVDVVDEHTGIQEYWCVVGRTYDAALKRFIKWANNTWDRYSYYFYEEEDKYAIEYFIDCNEKIEAGIYDWNYI